MEGPIVVTQKLFDYCQKNDWAGYDPYDALNSRIFNVFPFLNSRIPQLILTQALKRSPVNIRPLLLVPKTQNPKAIALFLMAFVKLSKLGLLAQEDLIATMIDIGYSSIRVLRDVVHTLPRSARCTPTEGQKTRQRDDDFLLGVLA